MMRSFVAFFMVQLQVATNGHYMFDNRLKWLMKCVSPFDSESTVGASSLQRELLWLQTFLVKRELMLSFKISVHKPFTARN